MNEQQVQLTGWRRGDPADALVTREWLVTNGLGGYATGTIAGVATRRYHGILVAALPAPLGRFVMLNHLGESIEADGHLSSLTGDEPAAGEIHLPDVELLSEFRIELGLPVWSFVNGRVRMTKRLMMPHLQNTTCITYELHESSAPVRLRLTPSIHFRPHEQKVSAETLRYELRTDGPQLEIAGDPEVPPLQLQVSADGARFERDERVVPQILYRTEKSRGYDHAGSLWTPGTYTVDLQPGSSATFVCSTEHPEAIRMFSAEEAYAVECERRRKLIDRADVGDSRDRQQLVLAADQFIIVPEARRADMMRARAAGDEPRTVIAGYHWFTDWGRDTMISLEGLTLSTGRPREAASILRTFASHVRDGLIPNMFPEGENEGLYHTADATLWFFHAVKRYVDATGDEAMLRQLMPVLDDVINHHLRGTKFGIGVDAADGLLRQGEEGYQLTWMDAKVDGWVVTPRRGKAVEINALFYNALKLLEAWTRDDGNTLRANELLQHAEALRRSFNERFWYAGGEYLYDVVDAERGGNDAALRPNQLFSISLDHPVLDRSRWERVVNVVRDELLTPVGLRSLSRAHPDYKRTYDGDLRSRDAAYHQGTVWSWLIGPFIDAWMKVYPDDATGARETLRGLEEHLRDACIGSVSEIFDAEEPYTPRGCIAQAWGVAELLRCLKKVG